MWIRDRASLVNSGRTLPCRQRGVVRAVVQTQDTTCTANKEDVAAGRKPGRRDCGRAPAIIHCVMFAGCATVTARVDEDVVPDGAAIYCKWEGAPESKGICSAGRLGAAYKD